MTIQIPTYDRILRDVLATWPARFTEKSGSHPIDRMFDAWEASRICLKGEFEVLLNTLSYSVYTLLGDQSPSNGSIDTTVVAGPMLAKQFAKGLRLISVRGADFGWTADDIALAARYLEYMKASGLLTD